MEVAFAEQTGRIIPAAVRAGFASIISTASIVSATSRSPFRFLPLLQLGSQLLDGQGFKDTLRSRGEQREDSEAAVQLVLLKSPPQARQIEQFG